MVAKNLAAYEPAEQTRSALLYWRLPEEWAEVLHEWIRSSDRAWSLLGRPLVLFMFTIWFYYLGVLDWSAQYHHDTLRDRRTSYSLWTFESAVSITDQVYCDLGKDCEGTGHRCCRWRGG